MTYINEKGETVDIETDSLILAIGHSAKDTVEMLYNKGIDIMQKPFSVGARIEHPREMINRSQYGSFAGHPALGAADYKLACHPPHGRGAYTFKFVRYEEVPANEAQKIIAKAKAEADDE